MNYGFRDIVADRFDAGVRMGNTIAKDMIAMPIGPPLRMAVVASPAYFADRPPPKVPQDLTSLIDNTKKNGNPVEGELVYRRAALTCTVCHAIGGAGGKVGPDLGTIGASAPLDYIIESTVNPAAKVKEGFHAIAVTTKDGKTLSGTIAKETDTQIVLRDLTGADQTVEKSNVNERTNIGSLMPAGLFKTNRFPGDFEALGDEHFHLHYVLLLRVIIFGPLV